MVTILFRACQLFHIVAVTCCQSLMQTSDLAEDILITCPILFCIFWMRFANLKKFYKALCRTHQIKGQYELLCLKWLESGLTTGQSFLYLRMSSPWFLWLALKNATNKPKGYDCYTHALLSQCSEIPVHPTPPYLTQDQSA